MVNKLLGKSAKIAPERMKRLDQSRKDDLFIIEDWNAKVGSQEIPGVTGKVGLGVQNEAGQRLTEFFKRMHWS